MIETVQQELKDLLGGRFDKLESPSLRLEKIMRYEKKAMTQELEDICRTINLYGKKTQPKKSFSPRSLQFQMRSGARMMINQSGSILNLSILIHRHYGCPCIPGSALKGVTRHYVTENELLPDTEVERLFGEQDSAGIVAFHEAFPANTLWKMVVDVLTNHHGCDTKNPLPITFPALEKGVVFSFSLSPLSACSDEDLKTVAHFLKETLKNYGVGAKTAAGYGYFREV